MIKLNWYTKKRKICAAKCKGVVIYPPIPETAEINPQKVEK